MKTIFTWEVGLLFFSLKGNPPDSLSRLPRLLPPVVAVLFRLLEAVLVILLCNIIIVIIVNILIIVIILIMIMIITVISNNYKKQAY